MSAGSCLRERVSCMQAARLATRGCLLEHQILIVHQQRGVPACVSNNRFDYSIHIINNLEKIDPCCPSLHTGEQRNSSCEI